ncbi:hypothetical protein [Kaistia granuli]|uniref:hypothetical protein n=1 Tax=Kaistia granuli TaxID=363259 RepID=UPI0012ECB81D|nr:hypothetical protein [Kaistia granuli]
MSMDNGTKRGRPRREHAARGAFYVWIAAYAAVIIAIVTVHGIGGTPPRATDSPVRQDAAIETLDHTPVGAIVPVARAGTGG